MEPTLVFRVNEANTLSTIYITRKSLRVHQSTVLGKSLGGPYIVYRDPNKSDEWSKHEPTAILQYPREKTMAMMLVMQSLPEELVWKVLCMLELHGI